MSYYEYNFFFDWWFVLLTHPVNILSQHTLSILLINTPSLNTFYQPISCQHDHPSLKKPYLPSPPPGKNRGVQTQSPTDQGQGCGWAPPLAGLTQLALVLRPNPLSRLLLLLRRGDCWYRFHRPTSMHMDKDQG